MFFRNTWLVTVIWLSCGLTLAGCNSHLTPHYEHSATYGRILKNMEYPADNDATYIPPKRYVPKVKSAYEDNDATYVFPKGRLARTPRQPYPQDNDATYVYPRGYKPKNGSDKNGNGYPADNDSTYQYPQGYYEQPANDVYGTYPHDNENDMLNIYPLHLD